jgi:16S rRNA processing protein RimM
LKGPLLEVGRIVKPHGIRGEVVVELVTNRTERVAPGAVLATDTGPLEVERSRRFEATGAGRWIVAFRGVADRPGAEALRGVVLLAEPIDDPEGLWVHQLVGAEVVDAGGSTVGRVTAVEANPASDLLVLDSGALIPLRFVLAHQHGRLEVDLPPGLLDL